VNLVLQSGAEKVLIYYGLNTELNRVAIIGKLRADNEDLWS
jgi:hypothetical protein